MPDLSSPRKAGLFSSNAAGAGGFGSGGGGMFAGAAGMDLAAPNNLGKINNPASES